MVDFFILTHLILWIPSLAIGQLGWELTEKTYKKYTENHSKVDASVELSASKMH